MENQLSSMGITDDVYRLGDVESQYNTYLMIDSGEGILIDPGSALGFERVFSELVSIIPLEKIKYVIVHHQGPDCCASLPLFEQRGLQATVVTLGITADSLQFYGVTSPIYSVNEEGFKLTLSSGRELLFLTLPSVHVAGAMLTYDSGSKTLFSSNLFGPTINSRSGLPAEAGTLAQYPHTGAMVGSVIEKLLRLDIARIAPQNGEVIDQDVKTYIKKMRDCDTSNHSEQRLSASGSYLNACNRVIKRLYTIYEPEKVAAVLKREGVLLDEQTGLVRDFDATGRESWNRLFEVLFSEQGIRVLQILEPLVQTIEKEDDIPIPDLLHSKLLKRDRKIKEINDKYRKLEAFNQNLVNSIEKIQDKFIRCPNTGLFNELFFQDFMKTAGNDFPEGALFLIDIDNLADIRLHYGTKYRDETMKNLAYLLKREKGKMHRLFKIEDSLFAYFIPETNGNEAQSLAEQIRTMVAQSDIFREKITLSIGLVLFKELGEQVRTPECISEFLHNSAFNRLRIAKINGNTVCGASSAEMDGSLVKTVLLVDTDDMNLELMKSAFEKDGIKVYTANDGVAALAITDTEKIDLIISELMLPKMDGLLLKENLSFYSEREKIPFILISHKKDKPTMERALLVNVTHYFKKPYMFTELIGIAKNRLKGGI
ncbi:nucleotide cyclase [Trichococcus palustris]|uniref:Nucleotide cyclase n=1 Tax=Trichococcus palustris TaxID=140314 RepID=A0A143YFY9_9LACT|nr:response regulator [Trichococcus palustris]CZQ89768.1 nucleotide cyclase [Trichococcus palustris]SFK98436.1 Diguanylate cyclase, GGDEF domain [Trichococcus palustris]